MGRWIVVVLAAAFTMFLLIAFFPSLMNQAFAVKGYGIKWALLVGCGVTYAYHRFTSRK